MSITAKIGSMVSAALASQDEVAAREERTSAAQLGTTAVGDCPERAAVRVSGVIRSVVLRPTDRVQAVEAELYDGSGTLVLVWLGRREIAGIEPGRRLRVEGMACEKGGRRVMYNPGYELRARPGE